MTDPQVTKLSSVPRESPNTQENNNKMACTKRGILSQFNLPIPSLFKSQAHPAADPSQRFALFFATSLKTYSKPVLSSGDSASSGSERHLRGLIWFWGYLSVLFGILNDIYTIKNTLTIVKVVIWHGVILVVYVCIETR